MAAEDPHDRFFNDIFRRPAEAAGLLAGALPASLRSVLDLDRLEPGWSETTESRGHGHRRDLVFRVPFAGEKSVREGDAGEVRVLVLLEHQSTPDRDMPLRLLGYMVRTWEDQKKKGEPLVPVVPVVVYHGRRRWRAALDFASWLVPDTALRTALKAVIPDFQYVLRGRRAPEPCAYTGTALARFAEFLLDHHGARGLAAHLEGWRRELRAIAAKGDGTADWHGRLAVVYYLYRVVAARDPEQVAALLSLGEDEEVNQMVMSTFDRLLAERERRGKAEGKAEGRAEGKAEGRAEGKAEGRAEGKADAVLTILEQRFGAVDGDTRRRILGATPPQLDRWLVQALNAATLEEALDG